ncbi:MAG: replicative DNA helicase [Actinomycetota bacterium]|nr:replicative DNA helicase [Actinomycetota bacterium]
MSAGMVPPNNEEAEVSVLGAVLLSEKALDGAIDDGLAAGDFYRQRNRLVFAAMLSLQQAGEPVDVLTVCEELGRTGRLEEAGGDAYVHSLPNLVPAAGNVRSYARIVKHHSRMRDILDALEAARAAVFDEDEDALAKATTKLIVHETGRKPRPTIEARQEALAAHVQGGEVDTWPWPWPALQEATGGIWPGHLTIVGGITSHGKSVLIDQVLEHVKGKRPQLRVALYLNEMSVLERDMRQISRRADIPFMRLMLGKLREAETPRFVRAVGELQIEVVECAGWSADEIARDIFRQGWNLIGLDLLNKLPGSSKTEDIDENVRRLADAATEAGCTILAAQHLNRGRLVGAYPPQPTLGDIRGSGQIADLANNVVFIYRKERVLQRADGENFPTGKPGDEAVLDLAKGRNALLGEWPVVFDGGRQRFLEVDEPELAAA